MKTEHYFIVKYDPSTGWSWDTDLEAGKFNGTIWDVENEVWLHSGKLIESAPEVYEVDGEASSQLAHALMVMNGAQ